jgi:haloalkane dehalogenase
MSRSLRAAYTAPYDSWANRIATLRFVQDIPLKPGDRGFDIVQATADRLNLFLDVPMMIAWGLKDFVFDRHFLDEWVRRFPNARVDRFEDCGHYILEDAGDSIIPEIQAFLAANPVLREVG